jgi:hypothetical protein
MRIRVHVHYERKTTQLIISANINRLKLYVKYSTKCATVTKTEDTLAAKLWSNGHA